MKFCIPSLTHLNMAISQKSIYFVKDVFMAKTWSKYTNEVPNILFKQMFTCFSCAWQNVASVMDTFRENCPPASSIKSEFARLLGSPSCPVLRDLHYFFSSCHSWSRKNLVLNKKLRLRKNCTEKVSNKFRIGLVQIFGSYHVLQGLETWLM